MRTIAALLIVVLSVATLWDLLEYFRGTGPLTDSGNAWMVHVVWVIALCILMVVFGGRPGRWIGLCGVGFESAMWLGSFLVPKAADGSVSPAFYDPMLMAVGILLPLAEAALACAGIVVVISMLLRGWHHRRAGTLE